MAEYSKRFALPWMARQAIVILNEAKHFDLSFINNIGK